MRRYRIAAVLVAASLGLAISFGLSSSAYAVLSSGSYVSSADPAVGPDSFTGADVWSVASIGVGTSSGHDSSILNGATPGFGIDDDEGTPALVDDASWRITADGFSLITSTAEFAAPLASSDFVALDFDPGLIDFGGRVEVRFLDGSDLVQASLIAFGGSPDFLFFEAGGVMPTSIPVSEDGFNLKLDVGAVPGSFMLDVTEKGAVSGTSLPGFLAGGPTSSIKKIQVFNQGAGEHEISSVYFNNLDLSIASTTAVPEVSAIVAIPFALGFTGAAVILRRRCCQHDSLVAAAS